MPPSHSTPSLQRPSARWRLYLFAILGFAPAFAPSPARAAEVQRHGVEFEAWVRDTFFEGYQPPSYTQKWDIPAAANRQHGGIPVNPKAARYGSPVDLGDALRQYDIDEPFILFIGFWDQVGSEKHFVHLLTPRIEPTLWRSLWGDVTRADLARLDAVIKDRRFSPAEARRQAQAIKTEPVFQTCVFTLNPKIDHGTQRRLQCSLGFKEVFARLAPDTPPERQNPASAWGVVFPRPLPSAPREFGPLSP